MKLLDYKSPVNKPPGGSKPGSDKRKIPDCLKLAMSKWATVNLAAGDSNIFGNQPNAPARFSGRLFLPLIPLLIDYFPEEWGKWAAGRDPKVGSHQDRLKDRFHKMFYDNDGVYRGRSYRGSEHVDNWSAGRRSAAERRLAEVRWPW